MHKPLDLTISLTVLCPTDMFIEVCRLVIDMFFVKQKLERTGNVSIQGYIIESLKINKVCFVRNKLQNILLSEQK